FLARPHRGNPISFVFKNASQSRLDRALVVDDQDVLARHWPPQAWTGAATGRPAGSSTTKRLPRGVLSSTRMVPPWSETIWWTIGSPRPIPVALVEEEGTNSRSRSPAARPAPAPAPPLGARCGADRGSAPPPRRYRRPPPPRCPPGSAPRS